MARIILLVALFLALYYVLRHIAASWSAQSKTPDTTQQKLVQCDHCGLHVPEEESIAVHGRRYCTNPACNPEPPQSTES